MDNIIQFKSQGQLVSELSTANEEIKALREHLRAISGLKDMMMLEALDLKNELDKMKSQISKIEDNVTSLIAKLNK